MDWFLDFAPWVSFAASLVGFVMGLKELREFKQDIKGKVGKAKAMVFAALLGWWVMAIGGLWSGLAAILESDKAAKEMSVLADSVSKLKTDNANAEAGAAKANERAALLEKEAAEARLEQQKLTTALHAAEAKAEAAHTLASQTEEKQRPRTIPPDMRAGLLKLLKNSPHGRITLGATESDLEAMDFMKSLASLLREAGNTVTESPWMMASGPNGAPVGLILKIKNKDKAPEFATIILNALHAAGLPLKGVDKTSLEDDNLLEIQVGGKPPK